MYEFHVSRLSREKYEFDRSMFQFDGNVIIADFLAARQFSQKINQKRDLVLFPEFAVNAGDINAIGLIDEIFHYILSLYRRNIDPEIFQDAYTTLAETYGEKALAIVLLGFVKEFPPISVYQGEISPEEYLQTETKGKPNKEIALEEMLMLWITNRNPAVSGFSELFDDGQMQKSTDYRQIIQTMKEFFAGKPRFGPDDQDIYTMLRSPALEEPYSLVKATGLHTTKMGFIVR